SGLSFRVGKPTEAGWIEHHFRTTHCGDAGTVGIPLIPANLHADARVFGTEIRETEIAGREIEFFIVERIVGDVHFAIFPEEAAVGVENADAVVVDTGSSTLKNRSDDRNFAFLANLPEFVRGRTWNWLGEIEEFGVFRAAEIFAMKKFVQAYDLRSTCGSFADFLDCACKIVFGAGRAFHLHESDGKFISHKFSLA